MTLAAMLAAGCAVATTGAMAERVGGAARARSFASPTAYDAYLRAEVAVARGDHAEALQQLDLAALADPADGYILARRAEVQLLAGDAAAARETAEALTRERPELSAAWLTLAEARVATGDVDGAMHAVARAVALDPDDPDVRAAAATVAGGDARAVAQARAQSPEARPGDRSLAARALALDPAGMFRRSAAARRRAVASGYEDHGEWARVDASLTPLVNVDTSRTRDRVRVIEARALDGRPVDAAPLVSGLRAGEGPDAVRPSEQARLWLVAGRPDLAAEEAQTVLRTAPDDLLAWRVLGHAQLQRDRLAEGIDALARVPPDATAGALLVLSRDVLSGERDAGGDVAGEGRGEPGTALAMARVEVAGALSRRGLDALAARVYRDALGRLQGAAYRVARDRVRIAWGAWLARRGDATAALADVETAWGRHRRAALVTATRAPADALLADLRVRSGDAREDALADAWGVLVCIERGARCDDRALDDAAARARTLAPVAPTTLRAAAARTTDRREADALAQRAAALDPLSPWGAASRRTPGGA